MMWLVLVFMFVSLLQAQETCNYCDPSCGNWSCITNCSQHDPPSNPTFDVPRCAVDSNGNGQIDDCSELLACQNVGGRHVCPVDTSDRLCTSNEWGNVKFYDTNPGDFDAEVWGAYFSVSSWDFSTYQQKLLSYSLLWPNPPQNSSDRMYQFIASNGGFPVWVLGGALYSDVWFSYDSCSYISYDGSQWQVKNNACSDPNKVWQKIGQRCYVTSWSHSISLGGQTYSLTWNVSVPQNSFNQNQYINVGSQRYRVNMRCVGSTDVATASGQIKLCTVFQQTVYNQDNRFLYALEWRLNNQWGCSPVTMSQSSSYNTQETMSSSQMQTFAVLLEERLNNVVMKGIGLDTQGTRCRPCSTSFQGLSGGVEKSLPEPSDDSSEPDSSLSCNNPRFFSGRRKTCRSGGLTTLGASCCGISGWFKDMCKKGEKELKKMREADLCIYIGDYCSKRVRFIGCVERRRSFCCFNSSLARIFQECGRPQIGRSFGDSKNPDCRGFTPEEFQLVDFSDDRCRALFEEYINRMISRLDLNAKAEEALGRVQGWINSQMEDFMNYNREPKRGY